MYLLSRSVVSQKGPQASRWMFSEGPMTSGESVSHARRCVSTLRRWHMSPLAMYLETVACMLGQ